VERVKKEEEEAAGEKDESARERKNRVETKRAK